MYDCGLYLMRYILGVLHLLQNNTIAFKQSMWKNARTQNAVVNTWIRNSKCFNTTPEDIQNFRHELLVLMLKIIKLTNQ